jgi:hypothetical protein
LLSVGAGFDAGSATWLEITALPDPDGGLDVLAPLSIPAIGDRVSEALSTVSFPHAYSVGLGLGTSDVSRWRVVAWVAHAPDASTIQRGEAFGTTTFTVAGCGCFGGYCRTTRNVDLALDQVAP